ncbi:MAG: hypothetical protein F4Y63_09970 [Chloroflexi bacterium]|nr:hypothetical protein [Chloroflexota bacterium]MYK62145.1 hypothetical protein [Chloroflexota bacterium]
MGGTVAVAIGVGVTTINASGMGVLVGIGGRVAIGVAVEVAVATTVAVASGSEPWQAITATVTSKLTTHAQTSETPSLKQRINPFSLLDFMPRIPTINRLMR